MKVFALMILSMIGSTAEGSDLTYYIKLDVSAPANQRDTIGH